MIVLELFLDQANIENDYLVKFLSDNKEFMKSSLEEVTKLSNEANINVDCYHGSNYPMSVTDLMERIRFMRCKEREKTCWKLGRSPDRSICSN